jgi:threonine dehydrogenase-like Zn-dependent dehydrogenase
VTDLATDRLPLEQAPDAYAAFQKKKNGTIKVIFQP